MKVAIIGGGVTGLTAAFYLSQKNEVTIFEKDGSLGGIAGCFREKGWSWSLEKYYHHFFSSDTDLNNLAGSLGIADKLYYKKPKTSIFVGNQIYPFDSPKNILAFPKLSIKDKFLIAATTVLIKLNPFWRPLEKITAYKFIQKMMGKRVFNLIWKPLLESKFGSLAPTIPASWFWTRIKKRSSKLGYFEGGMETLIKKLTEKIIENKGKIFLNKEVKKVVPKKESFEIIVEGKKLSEEFDKVIVAASPNIFEKITELPPAEKQQIKKLKSIGTICLVLKLKKSFLTDGTYWLNINHADFPFVAVVEHTNLIDKKYYDNQVVLYVGGYYPTTHPFFRMTKELLYSIYKPFLEKINPSFNFELCSSRFGEAGTLNFELFKDPYTQPIPSLNYSRTLLPSIKTSIPNLYWGCLHHVYPQDRGINYAIKLGKKISEEINSKFEARNTKQSILNPNFLNSKQ